MPIISQNLLNPFDEKKFGIWGTLGSGAGCHVHFIQTVLSSRDIDNIKLISDIPESKKWSIKDLFQRNINQTRVDGPLTQYLNASDRIKFFNPITLILLPHDHRDHIIKEIPFLEKKGEIDDTNIGLKFDEFEYEKFYNLGFDNNLQLGKFSWNKDNCFVVAIDGQHRLSALKNLKRSGASNIQEWKIPAVLLCIHKENNNSIKVGLLEAVRRVFIDINNKAETISPARKILLNDSSSLDVVSQEIIEFSHSTNDGLPLVFFDWRGDSDKSKLSAISSILGVEEVNSVLNDPDFFNIPKEGDKKQDLPNWLSNAAVPKGELSYNSSRTLREFVKNDFVPGFHNFLLNIITIKSYLFELENIFTTHPDGAYFLEKEAFGSVDNFDQTKESKYSTEYMNKIHSLKSNFPGLLKLDIGLRAILYVYSKKDIFERHYDPTGLGYTWSQHAEKIYTLINELIKQKWFEYKPSNKVQFKFLTGLTNSFTGETINYRTEQVCDAFGALLLRLSLNLIGVQSGSDIYTYAELAMDEIKSNYLKDFKKQIRSEIAATWTGNSKDLSMEVQRRATSLSERKMTELEKLIQAYDQFAAKYLN
jgi:DNA-sulfur modification-associated